MIDKPAIQIDGLCKNYPARTVLRKITLTVQAGEFVGLVGTNGAGKTTLIKCILDLCAVTSGGIRIFGESHRQTNARGRLMYLPEKFMPSGYLHGREFLQYMASLHQAEYDERLVLDLLNRLGFDAAFIDRPVREYSKGTGQKLGLVSCFLSGRELLILDEPMSGLDPLARSRLKQLLGMLRQKGRTLFYSTHLLEDVQAICDRVIILHGGEIRFSGTVTECCDAYAAASLEEAYLACVEA